MSGDAEHGQRDTPDGSKGGSSREDGELTPTGYRILGPTHVLIVTLCARLVWRLDVCVNEQS